MMHTKRSRARRGEVACPCCQCPVPSRTARTREKAQWKREAGL